MKTLIIAAMLMSGTAWGQTDFGAQQSLDSIKRGMSWSNQQRLQNLFDEQATVAHRRAEDAREMGEMEEWATGSDHRY